jgi:hypothetical protein
MYYERYVYPASGFSNPVPTRRMKREPARFAVAKLELIVDSEV